MSKTMELTWAEEIFTQLKWGKDRRSGYPKYWSWGITSRTYSHLPQTFVEADGRTKEYTGKVWVRFVVSGLVHQGYVYVFLTGGDDYTVLLVKKEGAQFRIIEKFDGVYCDQLSSIVHQAIEDPHG